MRPLFADSFYFFAILNRRDACHQRAVELSRQLTAPLLTTAWVLTELADGLASSKKRGLFQDVVSRFESGPGYRIVPNGEEQFYDRGTKLYNSRPDKQWSLTDCISFVVMEHHEITEALTGDHHFEQAGFHALLK